jgi:predicted AlkP superfamily pyrophosphatase or phosphodiesterase
MVMLAFCLLGVGATWSVAKAPAAADSSRPHVYLIIVDGLDAEWLSRMGRLSALRASGVCPVTYPEATGVMPARTNPNHVSLLTAVHPAAHAITGNKYWDRRADTAVAALESARAIEVETLFTVIESEHAELQTVAVVGKAKLGRLFEGVEGRQLPPDALWAPGGIGGLTMEPTRADDATAMDAVLGALEPEPDLLFASLSGLDAACHQYGPASAEAARALEAADGQVARLIETLQARGLWERAAVAITSDHGFTDVRRPPGGTRDYISFGEEMARARLGGLRAVSDGGVGHVYLDAPASASDAAARLTAARELALRIQGVTEALYRQPVPGADAGSILANAHPTWRFGHPRAGDLLLIAAPGVMFSDPPDTGEKGFLGNHGGPGELSIPLVFCGGSPRLRRDSAASGRPSLADVGATAAAWLGIRAPRHVDGTAVSPENAGHAIDAVIAP